MAIKRLGPALLGIGQHGVEQGHLVAARTQIAGRV